MAKEEELKRIDLKVNVGCCEGCRRKVMKAMSLKGVLRTEIKPSHDRVLVKKLAKVGKIAEVLPPPSDGDGKRRDDSGKKQGGDKPPPQAEKSGGGKDGDGRSASDDKATACKQECKKCAHGAAAADDKNGGDKEKAPPSKSAEEGDGFGASKWSSAPDHAVAVEVHQFQHYHRAEPAMVVPAYYPPPLTAAPYYGYYATPPPMMLGAPRRPCLLRPQPSRFDADYFNDDDTVGCSVM